MKRWLGPLVAAVVGAAGAHAATLHFAPSLIMDQAMATLEQRGVALHAFTKTPQVTPQTQSVVRSSPDLFYALCRYDLRDPDMPLTVRIADWPDYQSLSFFDARTDNFATIRASGKLVAVRLLPPGSAASQGAIVSPTSKGVILIRRLAPTAEQIGRAHV